MRPGFSLIKTLSTVLLIVLLGQHATIAAPRVVASIAPLHSLVAAVMSGDGEPRLLLRGGESPHSFSLRPSDARLLHDADLLFWIGPPLELPLARILPNLGVTRVVSMLETPDLKLLRIRPLPPVTDAASGAGASGHDHEHESNGIDPHIWLSPANAAIMVDQIEQALVKTDPVRAGLYHTNAQALKERLRGLDRDLRQQLAGLPGGYIVFHDAYRYLEEAYSLQPLAAVMTHPERSPGAAHLRALRTVLADREVDCLFSEPQFEPRLIAMLTQGSAIHHAVLDPLGAEIEPGPKAYMQMMRTLADTMAGCLRGGQPG